MSVMQALNTDIKIFLKIATVHAEFHSGSIEVYHTTLFNKVN